MSRQLRASNSRCSFDSWPILGRRDGLGVRRNVTSTLQTPSIMSWYPNSPTVLSVSVSTLAHL